MTLLLYVKLMVPLFHLQTYKCICNRGYTGDNCENEINECEINENPCNGGQCVDMLADYKCTCDRTGFKGELYFYLPYARHYNPRFVYFLVHF